MHYVTPHGIRIARPCVNTSGMTTATIFSPIFSYAENQQLLFLCFLFFLSLFKSYIVQSSPHMTIRINSDLRCFSNNLLSFHLTPWLYVHRLYLYYARACRSIFPRRELTQLICQERHVVGHLPRLPVKIAAK